MEKKKVEKSIKKQAKVSKHSVRKASTKHKFYDGTLDVGKIISVKDGVARVRRLFGVLSGGMVRVAISKIEKVFIKISLTNLMIQYKNLELNPPRLCGFNLSELIFLLMSISFLLWCSSMEFEGHLWINLFSILGWFYSFKLNMKYLAWIRTNRTLYFNNVHSAIGITVFVKNLMKTFFKGCLCLFMLMLPLDNLWDIFAGDVPFSILNFFKVYNYHATKFFHSLLLSGFEDVKAETLRHFLDTENVIVEKNLIIQENIKENSFIQRVQVLFRRQYQA